MSKVYAGIGSRQTPEVVCCTMEAIGQYMARSGWLLRSGGAEGADRAFQRGAVAFRQGLCEMDAYGLRFLEVYRPEDSDGHPEWFEVAEKHHPAWHRCSEPARRLHARNTPIILGPELDQHADLVICWTPGAKGEGGTGQGIRIARAHGIPVFDLADPSAKADLKVWLRGHGLARRAAR